MNNLESLADFFTLSSRLKRTIRYDSCPEKIQEPVAGHCWQMGLMISLLDKYFNLSINSEHALEIASVHDIGEYTDSKDFDSYFVHTGKLNKEDKDKAEEEAVNVIKNNFNCGQYIYDLWEEYIECKTPEAKFVKAVDKIESHIHFIERGFDGVDLNNASYQITYADNAVRNFPQLEPFLKILKHNLKEILVPLGVEWKPEYDYPN